MDSNSDTDRIDGGLALATMPGGLAKVTRIGWVGSTGLENGVGQHVGELEELAGVNWGTSVLVSVRN